MVNTEVLIIGAGAWKLYCLLASFKGIKEITVLESQDLEMGDGACRRINSSSLSDRELVRMVQHCTARFKNSKGDDFISIM